MEGTTFVFLCCIVRVQQKNFREGFLNVKFPCCIVLVHKSFEGGDKMITNKYALKINGGEKEMKKQPVNNSVTAILSYADFVQQDYYCYEEGSLNYIFILEIISNDFDLLRGESYRTKYKKYMKIIEKGNHDESHKADMYLCFLEMNIQKCLDELKNEIDLMIFDMYFHDEKTYNIIQEYNDALFDYIAVFKNGTSIREIRDAGRLLKVISELQQNEIFSKVINNK